MDLRWIAFLLLNYLVASQIDETDNCTAYQTLNDTSFRTDSNISADQIRCELFPPPLLLQQWFRFTSTEGGAIATQCTQNVSCGAKQQIWIKDSLPTYADGARSVRTCLKTSEDCCALETKIDVQTCSGYFVYKLGLTFGCSRYCINATAIAPPIMSTTTLATTTLQMSVPNSTTVITTSSQADLPTLEDTTPFLSSTVKPPIVTTPKISTTKVLTSVLNTTGTADITLKPTDSATTATDFLLHSLDSSHAPGSQILTAVQTSVSNSKSTPVIGNSKTDEATTSHGLDLRDSHPPSEDSNTLGIVVAVVASLVGLAVIAFVILCIYRKKCKSKKHRKVKSTYILDNDIPVVKKEGFVEKRKLNINSIGQHADAEDLTQREYKNTKGSETMSSPISHKDIPIVKEESFIGKGKFDVKSISQQVYDKDIE